MYFIEKIEKLKKIVVDKTCYTNNEDLYDYDFYRDTNYSNKWPRYSFLFIKTKESTFPIWI